MMAASEFSSEDQVRQIRFRRRVAEGWGILSGWRVLEVGCGQGDMTAVLADAVGSEGRVVAVDIADPSYGAPVSIGESTARLQASPLGERLEFHLRLDALDAANAKWLSEQRFDAVVLAHCTWYFDSLRNLGLMFEGLRKLAPRLLLSEWDLAPSSVDQLGHLMSVLIQGQVEAFKTESRANVRTPYSREQLRRLLSAAGWTTLAEHTIDASELADARWEVQECRAHSLRQARELGLSDKFCELIESQIDVLGGMPVSKSLNAYSTVAVTSPKGG